MLLYVSYWPAGLGLMQAFRGERRAEVALLVPLAFNAIFDGFLAHKRYVSRPFVEALGPWRGLSLP